MNEEEEAASQPPGRASLVEQIDWEKGEVDLEDNSEQLFIKVPIKEQFFDLSKVVTLSEERSEKTPARADLEGEGAVLEQDKENEEDPEARDEIAASHDWQPVIHRKKDGTLLVSSGHLSFHFKDDTPEESWALSGLGKVSANAKKKAKPLLKIHRADPMKKALFFLFQNRDALEAAGKNIQAAVLSYKEKNGEELDARNSHDMDTSDDIDVDGQSESQPAADLGTSSDKKHALHEVGSVQHTDGAISSSNNVEVASIGRIEIDHGDEEPLSQPQSRPERQSTFQSDLELADTRTAAPVVTSIDPPAGDQDSFPIQDESDDECRETLVDESTSQFDLELATRQIDLELAKHHILPSLHPDHSSTVILSEDVLSEHEANNSHDELCSLSSSLSGHAASCQLCGAHEGSNHSQHKDKDHEHKLPQNTYSFIVLTPTFGIPFNVALLVVAIQMTVFLLLVVDIGSQGEGENHFGIPANVGAAVRVGQLVALLIAILTQDDIIQGLEVFQLMDLPSFRQSLPDAKGYKIFLCILLLLVEGCTGVVASMILIMVSENVFDLLLNFTAIGFVSTLDDVVFFLSSKGFAGGSCKAATDKVKETEFLVPKELLRTTKRIILAFLFAVMVIGWSVVVHNQVTGSYLCSTIFVQMGDDLLPALGTFSGLYDLQGQKANIFGNHYTTYVDRHSGKATFGYCKDLGSWTLQWPNRSSGTGDPCDWVAKSSPTDSYDITETVSDPWFVKDIESDQVVVLEPFLLLCFECQGNNKEDECNGKGSCSNAVCSCDTGSYGLRCEFSEPCEKLAMDARTPGFVGTRPWSTAYERLALNGSIAPINSYHRPVYVNEYEEGLFDLIFFTGRRWVVSHTDLVFLESSTFVFSMNNTGKALATYFQKEFHAHWSNFSIAFISEPMDASTPADANSPLGLAFYEAAPQKSIQQREIQEPSGRQSDARLLCGTCNVGNNPCLFDGQCHNGTCECDGMSSGSLCEDPPIGNGFCNPYYNQQQYDFDGGDCCAQTCNNNAAFACGMDPTGFGFLGYYFCKLPTDIWAQDPIDFVGLMVAVSPDGSFLAAGNPSDSTASFFDKIGKDWIQRGPSLDVRHETSDRRAKLSIALASQFHIISTESVKAPYLLTFPSHQKEMLTIVGCKDVCKVVEEVKGASRIHGLSSNGQVLAVGVFGESGSVDTVNIYSLDDMSKPMLLKTENLGIDQANNRTIVLDIASIFVTSTGSTVAIQSVQGGLHALHLYDRVGQTYNKRENMQRHLLSGDLPANPEGPLVLSEDGNVLGLIIGGSLQSEVIMYELGTDQTWEKRGSLPNVNITSVKDARLVLSSDGNTVAVMLGDKEILLFDWNGGSWVQVGNSILQGTFPESMTMSSDGSVIAVGAFADSGVEQVSLFSTAQRRTCNAAKSLLHVSITTDNAPQSTSWELLTNDTGEVIFQSQFGDFQLDKTPYVEEFCISKEACHMLTIYDEEEDGLDLPGRHDISLNGEDVGSGSFAVPFPFGAAKRLFIGDECLVCPKGTLHLQLLVQTCEHVWWSLEDSVGSVLFDGESSIMSFNKTARENHWKDICIKDEECYNFNLLRDPPSTTEMETKERATCAQHIIFTDNVGIEQDKFVEWLPSEVHIDSQVGNCNESSVVPTTINPTTATPTTASPTTRSPTTVSPTTASPTTASPTTASPTTANPTTIAPTTAAPTVTPGSPTATPTTASPTTASPTVSPTAASPTTLQPTTFAPTTAIPTIATPINEPPSINSTSNATGLPLIGGITIPDIGKSEDEPPRLPDNPAIQATMSPTSETVCRETDDNLRDGTIRRLQNIFRHQSLAGKQNIFKHQRGTEGQDTMGCKVENESCSQNEDCCQLGRLLCVALDEGHTKDKKKCRAAPATALVPGSCEMLGSYCNPYDDKCCSVTDPLKSSFCNPFSNTCSPTKSLSLFVPSTLAKNQDCLGVCIDNCETDTDCCGDGELKCLSVLVISNDGNEKRRKRCVLELTDSPTVASPPTGSPTTKASTTISPTTASPTTASPSSAPSQQPSSATIGNQTGSQPSNQTSSQPSTANSTLPTVSPSTRSPTTANPTTRSPTTGSPTTGSPTGAPSIRPSVFPSIIPSGGPSELPSRSPSATPSDVPSHLPSFSPSSVPSRIPSSSTSVLPTILPNVTGSVQPSLSPSSALSGTPSDVPSSFPSGRPSAAPSSVPSRLPSLSPSTSPSKSPSSAPSGTTSDVPSNSPSAMPSSAPSSVPSRLPSLSPSASPSKSPSSTPSGTPSDIPSNSPSLIPSSAPSSIPSRLPSLFPSTSPSKSPSSAPSGTPSDVPSNSPSIMPSSAPSSIPSRLPSLFPSASPSKSPSSAPSGTPSDIPSNSPSAMLSSSPSDFPSHLPSLSLKPSHNPSVSLLPSSSPSDFPSRVPSLSPQPSQSPSVSLLPSSSPSPSGVPSSLPSAIPSASASQVPTSEPSANASQRNTLSPNDLPESPTPTFLPANKASRSSDAPSSLPSNDIDPRILQQSQQGQQVQSVATAQPRTNQRMRMATYIIVLPLLICCWLKSWIR